MMKKRLGDGGQSRVLGKKLNKEGKLLTALGDLDELVAVMAVVGVEIDGVKKIVNKIIDELNYLSGYLAGYNKMIDLSSSVKMMEDDMAGSIDPELKKFIRPGGELNIWFNWARTVARRAERSVVALSKEQKTDLLVGSFMNRLSEYLFWLGRRVK